MWTTTINLKPLILLMLSEFLKENLVMNLTHNQEEIIEQLITQLVNEGVSASGKERIQRVLTKSAEHLVSVAVTFGYLNAQGENNEH